MSTKRRRSNHLHNSKAPDISLESTANHFPVTKKPPKFNCKRNKATEKSDETQPTSSGLRFKLPALPRVTKGAEPVVNMSAKPVEEVLSHDESDEEVDELKSSSPVKIQTPPKKRLSYRNPQEIQITPLPPLDPGLLCKAAQAEVKARQLQAKAKKRQHKAQASSIESGNPNNMDLSSEDEGETDLELEPPKRQKQSSKGKETNDQPTVIVFNVLVPPLIPETPSSRRRIDTATSFEAFQDLVHMVLGCSDVCIKPQLLYKIGGTPETSSSIALESKDDWAACIEDVISSHSCCPKTQQLAPIDLVVVISEQYLKSLHAHQHPSSSTKAKGCHGKSKITVVKILNLDGSNDEDVEFDAGKDDEDTGTSTSLLSNAEKLKNMLRQCQKCGQEKMCKIDVQGNHTKVTFQMLHPWVKALAAEVHGVTLKSPPKNDMFSRFFRGPAKDSTSTLSISMDLPPHASDQTPSTPAPSALTPSTLAPGAPMPTYIPMPMPMYSPQWPMAINQPGWGPYTGAAPSPAVNHIFTHSQLPGHQISSPYSGSHISPSTLSPSRPPMISSDPPETLLENKYDTLDSFIVKFEQEDYWNIDGIAAMSKTELMAAPFGLSSGNAVRYRCRKWTVVPKGVDYSIIRGSNTALIHPLSPLSLGTVACFDEYEPL
ncbi:hypothetical protein FB446DRAFT_706576 [Lentinula raphanica]|nr:hypothetical protein FB446DRAFT_706576 [Lentinula raphanica]